MVGNLIVYCALSIIVFQFTAVNVGLPLAGPYKIIITKMEHCEDEGTKEVYYESKILNAGNGKYIYNSNISIPYDVDKNVKTHWEVQRWGNGGYSPRFFENTITCEEALTYLKDVMSNLLKSAGVKDPKCPIPKGNYTVKDWEVNMTLNNVPALPYNKYRAIFTYYHKDVKVGCVMAYGEVVPDYSATIFKIKPFGK